MTDLKVLIIAENASADFGGEAFLPLHYFRVLRSRGIETHLLTHVRVRDELESLYPHDLAFLHFVDDSPVQEALWKIGQHVPTSMKDFALEATVSIVTQHNQRLAARTLVTKYGIHVVHQPTPVSPRLPSGIHDVGAPVIIGPMNGDIGYPPGFLDTRRSIQAGVLSALRLASEALNYAIVGKHRAATLVVANARTRAALPLGFNSARVVELVENGVNLERFKKSNRPVAQGKPARFMFLGRLVKWKAVDILLHAFDNVLTTPAPELHIVGDGAEHGPLTGLANQMDSGKRIRFHGFIPQDDAAELMGTMDILVLPSLRECGGAVVLEAMAKGMPVIATRWGGPADYIDDSCGVLVTPSSRTEFQTELTAAMTTLAEDPAERARLGDAGRKKVEDEYDWERKVDRMLELYEEAVNSAEH